MKVTQIISGANALGAWGQTGANTANFVRSSLQSEGLLGAQCHLHMLGPFGKVPDRVTGAIFHALVQCVAPRGSQLYQNQNPTCQLIAGAFVFCSPPTAVVGHFFAGLFSQPQILGWALPVSELTFTSCTQVPVSCLRSYCQPFGTPSQGELSTPRAFTSGSLSFSSSAIPLLSFSHSISLPGTSAFILPSCLL